MRASLVKRETAAEQTDGRKEREERKKDEGVVTGFKTTPGPSPGESDLIFRLFGGAT